MIEAMRALGIGTCLVFLVAYSSGLLGQESSEGQFFGKPIRGISYAGDEPAHGDKLDSVIGLKPGDVLTRTAVKQAIQRLYDTGRYSSIVVEALPKGDGIRVEFQLRLNYYFNNFSLEGELDLRGRSPWELMPLPIGERFSTARLEEARQSMLAYMHERGYYLADVNVRTRPDEKNRQVDVIFQVHPGELATIASVSVEGAAEPEVQRLRIKLGFEPGHKYDRRRLRRRIDSLRNYLVNQGYLAAIPDVTESFQPEANTVALTLKVSNFGRVRVAVDGFKIDKDQLRRLLPILSGEGLDPGVLEEGAGNIRDYLEESGYPEAEVDVKEELDEAGVRVVRYSVHAGPRVTVAYVQFKNNHAFTEDQLLSVMQIQPAKFLQQSVYSISKLDSDVDSVKTLYKSKGYLEADVVPVIEPVKDGERLNITFEVLEGRLARTASLTIKGNRTLTAAGLQARMELQPGAPYSPYIADHDRQALIAAYNDAGFLQTKVSYRTGEPDATDSYPVEFDVDEGVQTRVDNIILLGNNRTRESVIDRRIALKKGEPLSIGKMLKTQQSLYNLGVFDLVRVGQQNPESPAPFQNVIVRVEEARQMTLRYGLGYQERERLRGTLELSHLNMFGTAQRADLRLRGSAVEQSAALNFQQPQLRLLPVNSYFTISAQKRQEVSFDARRLNMSYQYSHTLSGHSWALIRYNFRNVQLSNLKVSISEVGRQDSPRNLSTFSGIYINDTRDNYLDPEKGFFTSTDFSVTARLLGSNDYYSLFTQNAYYHRLPSSLLMAAAFRFGAAHPFGGDTRIPLSERFFAGGGSSLRGFDTDFAGPLDPITNQPLGGNALVIGNLELRVPVLRSVHLVGFYDTGNVFSTLSDVSLSGFSHTAGLGLRLRTPFGPFRIDYGYNLNLSSDQRRRGLQPGHLFLTIGPSF